MKFKIGDIVRFKEEKSRFHWYSSGKFKIKDIFINGDCLLDESYGGYGYDRRINMDHLYLDITEMRKQKLENINEL